MFFLKREKKKKRHVLFRTFRHLCCAKICISHHASTRALGWNAKRRWEIKGRTAVSRCCFSITFLHLASERKYADVQVLCLRRARAPHRPCSSCSSRSPIRVQIEELHSLCLTHRLVQHLISIDWSPSELHTRTKHFNFVLKVKLADVMWETFTLGVIKPKYFADLMHWSIMTAFLVTAVLVNEVHFHIPSFHLKRATCVKMGITFWLALSN